jgi:hypothetical protein
MRLRTIPTVPAREPTPADAAAGVVLLHGLARTRLSMRPLLGRLQRAGFQVVNPGYPSRRHPVETLARLTIPPAVTRLRARGATTIHFVTHSMGGILVRAWLAAEPLPELGRVVMLAPPNQGSEVVDWLGRFRWFHRLFGPAAGQLSTAAHSLPRRLGPADFPLGILIGDRGAHWPLGRCFTGANDGKVAVARAQLEGMADFRTVPCGHAFIMRDRRVQELVVRFLRAGRFGTDDGP